MKKTDVAMIIFIASVSVLIAYFVASATPLGNVQEGSVAVPTVERIQPEVQEPDPNVFNDDAINPQVDVYIDRENLDEYTEYTEIEVRNLEED